MPISVIPQVLENGEIDEMSVTSPVIEVGQTIVRELEPVQKTLSEVAATAKPMLVTQVVHGGPERDGRHIPLLLIKFRDFWSLLRESR